MSIKLIKGVNPSTKCIYKDPTKWNNSTPTSNLHPVGILTSVTPYPRSNEDMLPSIKASIEHINKDLRSPWSMGQVVKGWGGFVWRFLGLSRNKDKNLPIKEKRTPIFEEYIF